MRRPVITHLHTILVNVEGGEPVHTVSIAQLSVGVVPGGAVHVGDRHTGNSWEREKSHQSFVSVNLTLELLSQLFPRGGQALAVSAPRSEELDERHPGLGLLLEVVLVELHHGRGGLLGSFGDLAVTSGSSLRLVLVGVDEVGQIIEVPGSFVSLNLSSIPEMTQLTSRQPRVFLSPEVGQGGVTSDLVLLADTLSLGAVQLGDLHLGVGLELLGQLVPDGSQLLTVSTPRSVELNERVSRGDSSGEASLGENMKTGLNLGLGTLGSGRLLLSNLRTELLVDELLEAGEVSVAAVLDAVSLLGAVLEELEGGIAGDVLGRAEPGLLSAVDLGDGDLLLGVLLPGQLLPGGGESLAVSAPGSEEHDEVGGGGDLADEVLFSEVNGGDGLLSSAEAESGKRYD